MHADPSGQPSDLELAYKKTSYRVDAPDGTLVIHIDECHPDVDQLLFPENCGWAYITASNPGSVLLGEEENQRRQHILEEDVKQKGWVF
jgi:hypothetical protein